MSSVSWPPSFAALLRSYLAMADDEEIPPDLVPTAHGLSSMDTVSLLLDLETIYQVTIPDNVLATLASAEVGRLWAILAEQGAACTDQDHAAGQWSAPGAR